MLLEILVDLPESLPSNVGLVATFNPGCGIRKQAISLKQDLMCFLKLCNSGCWWSFNCNRRSSNFLPPTAPYSASYGKLQSLTKNCNLWKGAAPVSANANRPYSVKSYRSMG